MDAASLRFTVGDDPVLDLQLLPYDCLGSAAHAIVLAEAGLLASDERDAVLQALRQLSQQARHGELEISVAQEDGHTAIEQRLTQTVGDAGKKIHTGRSRNDQVLAALRLYVREQLLALVEHTGELVETLVARAEQHRRDVMPGYTHTRQAMPSTVGLLLAATAESLLADLQALLLPLRLANRSPLGSASGYGVPLPLARERVAALLGMDGIESNTLHVQNTRGKLEGACISALHQMSITLARLAADLIWGSSEALGFFSLPEAMTTGSSIMPQKRNPDVLELVRAYPSSLAGRYMEVMGLLHGLPSGYHRDLQRTKQPLLTSVREMRDVLTVMTHGITHLEVHPEACAAQLDPSIYATDHAYAHVRAGVPFREAYRRAKESPERPLDPETVLAARQHSGAPGQAHTPLLATLEDIREQCAHFHAGARHARQLLEPASAE